MVCHWVWVCGANDLINCVQASSANEIIYSRLRMRRRIDLNALPSESKLQLSLSTTPTTTASTHQGIQHFTHTYIHGIVVLAKTTIYHNIRCVFLDKEEWKDDWPASQGRLLHATSPQNPRTLYASLRSGQESVWRDDCSLPNIPTVIPDICLRKVKTL